MGAYSYTALKESGRENKGIIEGNSPRHIRQLLREKGLTPLTIEEITSESPQHKQSFHLFEKKISSADLALFTRQLATLVKSGLPLEETLNAVAKQTEKLHIKNTILAIRSQVLEGNTLASGFAKFPRSFSDLFRATVKAGEKTGHLDIVLERLADYTENKQLIKQKAMLALIYPVMLSLVAIVVVVALLTYVVPQVIHVFENMNQQLPSLTVGLIKVSDFLNQNGTFLLAILALTIGLSLIIFKQNKAKYWLHQLQLKIPLISKLVRGLNASRFSRTLSILMASGVPVLNALSICEQVLTNLPMRAAVHKATEQVREGAGLAYSLENSKQFPPILIHLIASGETSGNLEEMLERAATHQERETESIINTFLGLFEPFLIILMGGIVLTIVLAILLPIFNLNQLIQ
ncbi:MAG: type II secretion system inner membrane protein GspF [Methylococcales bacterium]|jgi:general secretion pathway protein F|nr:type II secretion system inner membrane protein GspF [Methylococcales bacterium]